MAEMFLQLYPITNVKSVKLIQIDTIPAAAHSFPSQTRSNNSGEYTLLTLIYLALDRAWITLINMLK